MSWLESLLTGPVEAAPCASVEQWWPRYRALASSRRRSIDVAILGGGGDGLIALVHRVQQVRLVFLLNSGHELVSSGLFDRHRGSIVGRCGRDGLIEFG